MRVFVARALSALALASVVGCMPETVPAAELELGTAADEAGAVGSSGAARDDEALASSEHAAPPVASIATDTRSVSGQASPSQSAPGAAARDASAGTASAAGDAGPTAAVARLEVFTLTPAPTNASASASGAMPMGMPTAGFGALPMRPALGGRGAGSSATMPSAEICERVKMVAASGRAGNDRRVQELLASCAAQSGSAGGSATAPATMPDAPLQDEGVLSGTAVFTHAPMGVSLLLVLDGCEDGALYPVRIHAGASCADRAGIGELWDRTRGADIPDITCQGSHATQEYVRTGTPDNAWSLGGSVDSDVIGHALVIGHPNDRTLPLACGVVLGP